MIFPEHDSRPKRLRFAPSPNGFLHLGHAYSALLNWDFAKTFGADFVLRLEDIDLTRCHSSYEDMIFEDLHWLGLSWAKPVMRQSERFEIYNNALECLKDMGVVYPAFLSRREVKDFVAQYEAQGKSWPRDPDGALHYPDICKQLSPSERLDKMHKSQSFAWRLDMKAALDVVADNLYWFEADMRLDTVATQKINADPLLWGDVILARSDTPTSYHLSVVVDDAAQKIDYIMRGRDLYHATSVHVLLQHLLGLPQPNYYHHDLILDAAGRKLSKSDFDHGLHDLRQKGVTSDQIRAKVGL